MIKNFKTKNGATITINPDKFDLPEKLLMEAIGKIKYFGNSWCGTVDLGRTIGKTNCVTVTSKDTIRKMYLKGRYGKTPVVLNRQPEDTPFIGIKIQNDTVTYTCVGVLAPKEPWDSSLKDELSKNASEHFWNNHAIIYNDRLIDPERN